MFKILLRPFRDGSGPLGPIRSLGPSGDRVPATPIVNAVTTTLGAAALPLSGAAILREMRPHRLERQRPRHDVWGAVWGALTDLKPRFHTQDLLPGWIAKRFSGAA